MSTSSAKSSGKKSAAKNAVKKGAGSSSGNRGRCSIYDDIDSLADCAALPENKRFPTFVAQLQKILNQLAYYCINSDGAILEEQERWHETFADRLYEAAGQARTEAIAQRAVTTGAPPGGPSTSATSEATGERALPAVIPTRKPPDDIPDSLRRIMNGSHESLHSDDDD